jgi:hypothetical protein
MEFLEDRITPSTLIPVANHRDLVFDSTRDLLYITTSAGAIQQYSIPTQTLLSPLTVGTSLNGADISADGSALFVAESQTGATQGVVHEVNLATDVVTDLSYNLGFYEGGSWDVALGAGGKGLVTTSFNGSGWTPLRQIDLSSGTLSIRTDAPGSGAGGEVFGSAMIHRSADRSTFLVTESGISSGPLFLYNASTDTFSIGFDTNTYLDFGSAINRNGSLIAYEKYGTGAVVLDRNFNTVTTLAGIDGGVAFDPVHDILYGVNTSTSQIVAYDTSSWTPLYQMAIGETVSTGANLGNGAMTLSNDGSLLFLATPSGVRMFNLPSTTVASSFVVNGFPSSATAGVAGSFTVTAINSAGSTAVGYAGTVHFSSSDGNAQLPGNYTFTAADHGVHTFSAVLTTAGVQSLTAVDQANASATGTQTGITVTAGVESQLVVSGPTATAAGTAFSVTVRALDAFGNQATGYNGTVHFSSSDAQAGLPADYTFTAADAGVHTFAATLKTAGNESLTVTDTGNLTSKVEQISVTPAAASRLSVGGFPSPITAGVTGSFTVSALDAYGNVATGYTGTVRFSTGSQATLPPNYTFTSADQGVHTFNATLFTAGTFGLLVTDVSNSSITGTQSGIVVNAGAVSGLRIYSISPNSYPANTGKPTDVTVMGADAYGNAVPGYTGTVHFTSSDGAATLPADYTFTAADNGLHTFVNGVTMQTAGTQTITATDTGNSAFTSTMSLSVVNPMSGFHLAISTSVTSTVAGTPFSFTVTALDGNNNTITGYTGTVYFSCSTGHAYLPYSYTFTAADNGVHTFTNGAILYGSGNQVINAVDYAQSSGSSGSATVTVAPAAAYGFGFYGVPTTTSAGSANTFTVAAFDYYGNLATGYTGTVHFSSSDSQAVLPADATLNGGYSNFSAVLKTAGTQSLTVTDTANSALTVTQSGITVNPAAAISLVFYGYPITLTAGTAAWFLFSAIDAYGNVATSYNGTVHFSSSDAQAVLPANATLNSGQGSVTANFKTAGTQSFTVTDTTNGALTATHGGITVNPAAASTLLVSGFPSAATAGTSGSFRVVASDAFGNVATGYSGTVHFTSSDAQAILPANATLNNGVGSFNATFKTAGTQTLVATDTGNASITGTEAGIIIAPAAASTLSLTGFPATVTAGAAGSFSVTARDAFGNVATGYSATIHFTSSDAQAILPVNATLNNGVGSFNATFKTAGSQTLVATDTGNASITGTEAGIIIAPAAASTLSLTGFPANVTAGAAATFSVTARDAFGNVATGYRGTVHLASSDPRAALSADYTFTAADAGNHVSLATLTTAGNQTLTVSDTGSAGVSGTQFTVSVTAGATSSFAITGFPATGTAGVAENYTVTATDAYGNVTTGYTGTVHFSSSDSQAVLPANYAFLSADAGKHSFSAALKTAGSQSLFVQDTVLYNISGIFWSTVTAASASWIAAYTPSSTTAGTAQSLTVYAYDPYGNIATGYTGTVHVTSSDAQATLPANYTFTAADAGVHTLSVTLKTAGTQSITVQDLQNGFTGRAGGIAVSAAAASRFTMSGFPSSTAAGAAGSLRVTAFDVFGNIAAGYAGTVHFTSSDAQAGLPGDYTFTGSDQGAHVFSATLKTAGTQSLTVTDPANSSLTATQTGITVVAASMSGFLVSGFPATTAGVAQSFKVTAVDAYGNLVTSYTGAVHFTSSDAKAGLPGNYTFAANDKGVHVFSATLKTAGTQSLTVTDTVSATITGSETGISVSPGAATTLTISAPATASVGAPISITVTARDAYGNIATGYLGTIHFTSSDNTALLPANYTFVAGDAGVHVFGVTFKKSGTQNITATDTKTGSIKGSDSVKVQ